MYGQRVCSAFTHLGFHIRVVESERCSKSNDPINNKVTSPGGQTNQQTASTRNKRIKRAARFRLRGGETSVRVSMVNTPTQSASVCRLRALPLQALVIINRATLEIIFWANILIKTVPSVACMPSLHLVPISTPLSSKSRDRGEGGPQMVANGENEWDKKKK